MTNRQLLKEIREGFNDVQNKDIKGYKNWTNAFKDVLLKIGKKEGFKVCTSSLLNKDYGEWLFDLCWSNEEKGVLRELKLICEIEWKEKIDHIIDDFQKLSVGKADLKIMIVQYNGEEKFENIKKSCEKSVHKSLFDDGAKYILVGSGNNENDVKIKWVELWKKK